MSNSARMLGTALLMMVAFVVGGIFAIVLVVITAEEDRTLPCAEFSEHPCSIFREPNTVECNGDEIIVRDVNGMVLYYEGEAATDLAVEDLGTTANEVEVDFDTSDSTWEDGQ